MLRNIKLESQAIEVAQTTNGDAVDLAGAKSVAVACHTTNSTPSADNFLAGESEVNTLTFEAKASMDDGEYVIVTDTNGDEWAVAADLTGSSAEPTGARWAAIPSARKDQVDLSSATDAASVAAAFEAAFDGISGFSAVCATDDSAADGTMLFTQVARGPVANAESLLEDDAGAGGVSVAQTNEGVESTVDVSANTITIASHGFKAGLKGQLTTTGTLPAGLSTSTDYFVIVVDDDTIKLASSLSNANAGTAIDITDQGADGNTHTFTATSLAGASVKLQHSLDGENWFDISGATANITATANNLLLEKIDPTYNYIRAVHTLTAGQLSQVTKFLLKAES